MTEREWRTVDFRPVVESGWRALYLDDPAGRLTHPIAGWLVEELYEWREFEDFPHPTGYRRVVAAECERSQPVPVDDVSNFWTVLAPGEPEPSTDDEQSYRAMLARAAAHRERTTT